MSVGFQNQPTQPTPHPTKPEEGGEILPREKECYRDTLCRLDEHFPGRELITTKEAAQWLGIDPRTVRKIVGDKILPGNKISKVVLARAIS